MLISPLLLILEVWDDKPTCGKSWGGGLLVWSDLTFNDPSFGVGQGWPNLKVLVTRLLLVPEVWDGEKIGNHGL